MHDPNQETYERICFLLDEVEARLEEGYPDEALQIGLQAERLLARNSQLTSNDLAVDTHYCLASALLELHDIGAALRRYEKVRNLDPTDREIDYWHSRALFHAWQFDAAERMLKAFRPGSATRAATYYYRALLKDFHGEHDEAGVLFSRAQKERPDEYPSPLRLTPDQGQETLDDVLYSLPVEVHRVLDGVSVSLAPLPDPPVHASPDIDPLVTSLYRTTDAEALVLLQHRTNPSPSRGGGIIEVFQRNVELLSTDRDEFREEMRLSLLRQIGQHLGRDDLEPIRQALN